MKRKSLRDAECPIARTLDVVGEWWTLLILRDAFLGVKRFSVFQRNLGLAKNVLSERLSKLVAEGILETVPASDGSTYQEYILTEKGQSLQTVLIALRQWGEANMFGQGEACTTAIVEAKTGQPIGPLQFVSKDGRPLSSDDITLIRTA